MNIMAMRWGRLYEGTPAEHSLEDAVAALGVPYRTQFPGWKYGFRFFPDFLLPTIGIVIEVDDASHDRAAKKLKDADRTEVLEGFGWTVLRCTNEQALSDPYGTVERLLKSVRLWPVEPGRCPPLADTLPALRRAPRSERRKAKSINRRRARQKRF